MSRLDAVTRSGVEPIVAEREAWAPCSDRSRERADPLAATASRGLQWFLVEVEGPWGANAFAASALGRELGQAIVHRVEAAGMRPLAIRRVNRAEHVAGTRIADARVEAAADETLDPLTDSRVKPRGAVDAVDADEARDGARDQAVAHETRGRGRAPQSIWRWAFVDSRPGLEQVRWGEVADPHELLEVALDGSAGIHSAKPIFCVCTHAKHDQCCAVRGRPAALALAGQFPDETWECSHLGGDRFAGTMAVFPEGLYFGRADDTDAVQIVRDYAEGRVDERFFRGRSSLSHPVQAAQHFARQHFGVDRLDAFAPLGERLVEGERSGVVEVELAAYRDGSASGGRGAGDGGSGGRAVRVVVAESLSAPLLSTCAATRFGRVREYELVSLD